MATNPERPCEPVVVIVIGAEAAIVAPPCKSILVAKEVDVLLPVRVKPALVPPVTLPIPSVPAPFVPELRFKFTLLANVIGDVKLYVVAVVLAIV